MSEKKYNKEYCIVLLKEKQKLLQSQGVIRYPKRSDFDEREMVAIKAFLGPWPRALEFAGIKPPREVNEQAKEEKKLKKKRAKIERIKNAEKEKVIIDLALSEGFAKAKILNTEHLEKKSFWASLSKGKVKNESKSSIWLSNLVFLSEKKTTLKSLWRK